MNKLLVIISVILLAFTLAYSETITKDFIKGDSNWIDSREYASINAAVEACDNATVAVYKAMTLTSSLTIPAACGLVIYKGGSIAKALNYKLIINGPFQAGLFTAFTGFNVGDVIFSNSSGTEVNPVWWGADITGTANSTTALQSSIAALRTVKHGSVKFTDGTYLFNSTLIIDIPVAFGGDRQTGARWNRMTSELIRVRLVWTGDNKTPAILVGGTADSPFAYRVEGVYLHDFVLIPDAALGGVPGPATDGLDGIIFDGSQNGTIRNDRRLATRDIIVERVVVRHFGRNNYRLEGNVFDVRFNDCVSTVSGEDGIVGVNLTSVGLDHPGQIHLTNSYMNSSFEDKWAVNFGSVTDVNIVGGGVSGAGNGVKMFSYNMITGTHFEGDGRVSNKIGIHVNGIGSKIMPMFMSGYTTLIRIGTSAHVGNTQDWFAAPGYLAGAANGLHLTDGGGRRGVFVKPHFDNVTNQIVNDRLRNDGIYELKYLKGYEDSIVSFPANDTTPSLLVGGDFVKNYRTNNSVAKTVTDFNDGYNGQTITIIINDANTTFQHAGGAKLRLSGAENWTPSAGDTIMFIRMSNLWHELSRSDNT